LSLNRLPGNQIKMTQELIANMLGVRREGVTAAASELRSAGLISYHRGLITVLDRPALKKRVCECYAVVKRETDRLLNRRAGVPAQAADGLAECSNAIKQST
jgi:Mn-dependent DtxR family transcriptional regulator